MSTRREHYEDAERILGGVKRLVDQEDGRVSENTARGIDVSISIAHLHAVLASVPAEVAP